MTFAIRSIQPWGGAQVIIWLTDEKSGADGPEDGTQWCVRLTLPEVDDTIHSLLDAFSRQLQEVALDLAAGGCRTCGNRRFVGGDPFADLMGGVRSGEPCPVCVPRAEERLRKRVFGLRRRPGDQRKERDGRQ